MVERPKWIEGQQVEWKGVRPYTIVSLVGDPGNIHIDEQGHYNVYWHREQVVEGRVVRTLVHHGGKEGFESLSKVKCQHERVILRYVGIAVDISPEDQEEGVTPEESESFPQLATGLTELRLEIPGEQQSLGEWISTLQKVSRDLPQIKTNGDLTLIRESLVKLLRGNLGKSINRYKRIAAGSLEAGLEGGRGNLLRGVNEAQIQLLLRAQQTVAITLGTMQRYNALEALQIYYNGLLDTLTTRTARAVINLQNPNYPRDRLERAINSGILDEKIGLEANLRNLKGEPYFSKAQEFIKQIPTIKELWAARNQTALVRLLTKQVAELEIWKRRMKEEFTGVNFGKYSLS